MVRRCPRCEEELQTELVEGVAVDGCPQCGGIWFDEKELTQVAMTHRGALLEAEDRFTAHRGHHVSAQARGGKCPNCGQPLLTFELKHSRGILLDGCRTCKGIWVDDGELRALWKQVRSHQPDSGHEKPVRRPHLPAIAAFLTKVHCPVCDETNPATASTCWKCQAVLKGRRGAMLCPHCGGRLLSQVWGELSLDRCQSCGGLWMTDQVLARLLAQDPPPPPDAQSFSGREQARFALLEVAPVQSAPAVNQRLCPLCHQPLDPYESAYSSGVYLHKCRSCRGVWLDGGQWDTLTRFLSGRRT